MTRSNKTCAACLQLQQRVEQEAAREPKTIRCYAGLSETAVPVRVGDKLIGYLQTGQVFLRVPSKESFNDILPKMTGREAPAGKRELETAYFQTRVVARKHYESIIRLLAIFAEHLATISNQILLTEATAESPVIAKGRKFIAEHQSEALSLHDAARALNMSSFYFCKMFKQETGLTFTNYLARVRTEAVKQMLRNAQTHVTEAAFAAGFQSVSQFNRAFRRIAGETPSKYRDRIHGLNGKPGRNGALFHAA